MSDVGQPERQARERVVRLFSKRLDYDYLGNREYWNNANVEVGLLQKHLLTWETYLTTAEGSWAALKDLARRR
ncbi:MAG: hypothetical protein HKL82_08810 [Acidimicrobiaceae bacterium]|nr:hypothetical protein [Acidimicrobiaceae bacterium]